MKQLVQHKRSGKITVGYVPVPRGSACSGWSACATTT